MGEWQSRAASNTDGTCPVCSPQGSNWIGTGQIYYHLRDKLCLGTFLEVKSVATFPTAM